MGWEDRPYYRDRGPRTFNPLTWILTGSVPLFTVFDIRVRAHASLVLTAALMLIGLGFGFAWQDRVTAVTLLFCIILLHEFGHCFAARWVGGDANDILMHPLGGLAYASPPRRPLPTFITVAAGPAVNAVICLITGGMLWASLGILPWNPFRFVPLSGFYGWTEPLRYALWIYQISWSLLCFNLMPIFPLDGGQMLQAILWPKFGYYKSMLFACVTGMVGAVLGCMIALATFNIGLAILAVCGFLFCYQMRLQTLAAGPYAFTDDIDYGLHAFDSPSRRRKVNKRAVKKVQKAERLERIEQRKIDAILAKVSAKGMHTLTWWEKRTLRQATDRQRRAEGGARMGRKTRV